MFHLIDRMTPELQFDLSLHQAFIQIFAQLHITVSRSDVDIFNLTDVITILVELILERRNG